MDPLLRDQIQNLRARPDEFSKAQATILEVLVEVREQTTKTNGRVTKLEERVDSIGSGCPGVCVELEERVDAIEAPIKSGRIIWGALASAGATLVVILGLVFVFLDTPLGERMLENKEDAIAAAVARALAEQAQQQPQRNSR
jgi:hypothetical protein